MQRVRLERERRLSLGLRVERGSAVAPSEALSRRLLDAFAERQLAQPAVARGASRMAGNAWLRAVAAALVAAGGVLLWSSASNKSERQSRATPWRWPKFGHRRCAAAAPSVQSAADVQGGMRRHLRVSTSTLASTGASRSGATGRFCGLAGCGGPARFRERRDRPYRDPADIVANLRNRDSARRTGLTCRGRFASGAGWPGKGDSIGDDERVAMKKRSGAET